MLKQILFFVIPFLGYAQQEICFYYDKSGNQRIITICDSGDDQLNDEELFRDFLSEEHRKDLISEKIELNSVPNPAMEQITVRWKHTDKKEIQELFITSIDGKILYKNKNLQQSNSCQINISNLTAGTYLLIAEFVDGSRKVFKVIKR